MTNTLVIAFLCHTVQQHLNVFSDFQYCQDVEFMEKMIILLSHCISTVTVLFCLFYILEGSAVDKRTNAWNDKYYCLTISNFISIAINEKYYDRLSSIYLSKAFPETRFPTWENQVCLFQVEIKSRHFRFMRLTVFRKLSKCLVESESPIVDEILNCRFGITHVLNYLCIWLKMKWNK